MARRRLQGRRAHDARGFVLLPAQPTHARAREALQSLHELAAPDPCIAPLEATYPPLRGSNEGRGRMPGEGDPRRRRSARALPAASGRRPVARRARRQGEGLGGHARGAGAARLPAPAAGRRRRREGGAGGAGAPAAVRPAGVRGWLVYVLTRPSPPDRAGGTRQRRKPKTPSVLRFPAPWSRPGTRRDLSFPCAEAGPPSLILPGDQGVPRLAARRPRTSPPVPRRRSQAPAMPAAEPPCSVTKS